jgi:hypothetical protein
MSAHVNLNYFSFHFLQTVKGNGLSVGAQDLNRAVTLFDWLLVCSYPMTDQRGKTMKVAEHLAFHPMQKSS